MNYKRITLLCGHYGSGKTNVAVNMALDLREQYNEVAVADMDIVNPYFRTKDSKEDFENAGIKLICSDYANTNVDIPALPSDIYTITSNKNQKVIIDVGGDDRGALALGRLVPDILKENDYEMLMVINCFRPLTRDAESTLEVMEEIQTASGMKFTGLVNNSNLGEETTAEDVLSSVEYAKEISQKTGLPLVATAVKQDIFDKLDGKIENLLKLKLQNKIK